MYDNYKEDLSVGGPTSVKTLSYLKILSMSFIELLPALEFVEQH